MDWINVSWKLLAAVAVMQFNRRCVVLAFLWKLLSYARVMHSVFVGLVTQLCSPSNVESGHTCVYINLIFRLVLRARLSCREIWPASESLACETTSPSSSLSPSGKGEGPGNEASLHHARHTSCSVFTALWCGCSVVKLSSPDPILALASMDTHLSSPHQGIAV